MAISQVKVGSTTHDVHAVKLTTATKGTSTKPVYFAEGVPVECSREIPVVYTAAECSTYTSDAGTCTPSAVKKAVTTFAKDATIAGLGYTPFSTAGGALTGTVMQTKAGNPYYGLNDGTTNWYLQAVQGDGMVGLGPTWAKATKWDANGNMYVAGDITAANLIGNASTASVFSSAASITLSGDIGGTDSSAHGWNINTTLASDAVTTTKIKDAAVTTAKIANSNVTTAKIANNAVTTAKIADSNVTTAKIANNAITATKIADKSVSLQKLANEIGVVVVQSSEPSSDSAAKIWVKI